MKQLSEKITKYVIKTGAVSPELYVVYQYGFQIGLEMLCCFVTCLSIATYMHGEYKQSIGLLYGIAFTIKMSKKEDHQIDGYFDYVVPPLEGFWWQEGVSGIDYARKEEFKWISVIRLPDFVSREDFDWAVRKATEKKKQDFSKVEFFSYDEGLCVQCMHIGSYDDEPATVDEMHRFMEEQGYALDITDQRMHHEIYLSDARRVAPEKRKTVVRHPIRRA